MHLTYQDMNPKVIKKQNRDQVTLFFLGLEMDLRNDDTKSSHSFGFHYLMSLESHSLIAQTLSFTFIYPSPSQPIYLGTQTRR